MSETHLVKAEIVAGLSWFSGKAGCLASSGLLTAPVDWSPGLWMDIIMTLLIYTLYLKCEIHNIWGEGLPDFCYM